MSSVREGPSFPVVVTGASGFVGRHLVQAMSSQGVEVRSLERGDLTTIAANRGEAPALAGAGAVVHLAARAHVLDDTSGSLLDVYRQSNRDLTLALAQAAAAAGIARFVFVSSVRVNGSASERPFRPGDRPEPDEPYAISKYEAEVGLWKIAAQTGLEVVVIRPPLVYGPHVKANFRRLLWLAGSGLPLPLGAVGGLRSLVGIENLCGLLQECVAHPGASGKMLFVSDGEDISLPDLITELARGMNRRARLFRMPRSLVRAGAGLLGKASTFDKLTASLQVDASETFACLGWRPPVSLKDGLHQTARWYLGTRA